MLCGNHLKRNFPGGWPNADELQPRRPTLNKSPKLGVIYGVTQTDVFSFGAETPCTDLRFTNNIVFPNVAALIELLGSVITFILEPTGF